MRQHPRHIIGASDLADRALLEELFVVAADLQKRDARNEALRGKILASLFFEPSTRTRFSFEAAMLRLGGQVISSENAFDNSSAKKGEALEDTIRIVAGYADCIVLRHPETGAAGRAAAISPVPIVNAGDGSGEHPTQALLDLYTVQKELGRLDNLTIVVVGDFLYGRTVHSLVQLLALYQVRLILVSPPALQLPKEYMQYLKEKRLSFEETENFAVALQQADVVYMTRAQKERFRPDENLLTSDVNKFSFGEKELGLLKKDAIILHPLPRVGEIALAVDKDPRAAYFRQAVNGLYCRMALIYHLFR